jgi:hypothetical protein
MKSIRKLLAALLIAIAVFPPSSALAGGRLPSNLLIGDDKGIEVRTDGSYFIDIPELRPSETYRKTLTINNLEDYAYRLTLVAKEETVFVSGPQNLLEKVSMQMFLDGDEVYDGLLNGRGSVDMVFDGVDLGKVEPGELRKLEIILRSAADIELFRDTYSEAAIGWDFVAVSDSDPDTPKTGVIERFSDWIVAGGMALIFILAAFKKKTEEKYAQL